MGNTATTQIATLRSASALAEQCFLCHTDLLPSPGFTRPPNATREHVFPLWVLDDHQAHHQSLTLSDGRTLDYTQATVPCCVHCSTRYLAPLEARIRDAFRIGLDAVQALPREDLYLWLAKTYYALRILGRGHHLNPANPHSPLLVEDDDIADIEWVRTFLQRLPGKKVWNGPHHIPGSINLIPVTDDPWEHNTFAYHDSDTVPFLSLRIAGTGVLFSLEDWGEMESVWRGLLTHLDTRLPHLHTSTRKPLNPQQFTVLAVRSSLLLHQVKRTHRYLTLDPLHGPQQVVWAGSSPCKKDSTALPKDWARPPRPTYALHA